jgi:hypothetical protein
VRWFRPSSIQAAWTWRMMSPSGSHGNLWCIHEWTQEAGFNEYVFQQQLLPLTAFYCCSLCCLLFLSPSTCLHPHYSKLSCVSDSTLMLLFSYLPQLSTYITNDTFQGPQQVTVLAPTGSSCNLFIWTSFAIHQLWLLLTWLILWPEYGEGIHQNVGELLDYMVSRTRRQ